MNTSPTFLGTNRQVKLIASELDPRIVSATKKDTLINIWEEAGNYSFSQSAVVAQLMGYWSEFLPDTLARLTGNAAMKEQDTDISEWNVGRDVWFPARLKAIVGVTAGDIGYETVEVELTHPSGAVGMYWNDGITLTADTAFITLSHRMSAEGIQICTIARFDGELININSLGEMSEWRTGTLAATGATLRFQSENCEQKFARYLFKADRYQNIISEFGLDHNIYKKELENQRQFYEITDPSLKTPTVWGYLDTMFYNNMRNYKNGVNVDLIYGSPNFNNKIDVKKGHSLTSQIPYDQRYLISPNWFANPNNLQKFLVNTIAGADGQVSKELVAFCGYGAWLEMNAGLAKYLNVQTFRDIPTTAQNANKEFVSAPNLTVNSFTIPDSKGGFYSLKLVPLETLNNHNITGKFSPVYKKLGITTHDVFIMDLGNKRLPNGSESNEKKIRCVTKTKDFNGYEKTIYKEGMYNIMGKPKTGMVTDFSETSTVRTELRVGINIEEKNAAHWFSLNPSIQNSIYDQNIGGAVFSS